MLYFYPRSPCGERLKEVEKLSRVTVISIHALLAESDSKEVNNGRFRQNISIHALLAESDRQQIADEIATREFLSTLSLRRATVDGPVGRFD